MQRQERNIYGRSVPEEERSSLEDAQNVSIFLFYQYFIDMSVAVV